MSTPELRPLRGLRYTDAGGALDQLLAPPYDVIPDAHQKSLAEQTEHNVIYLEKPADQAGDTAKKNRYTRAAATLQKWRKDGVLALDEKPTAYVYEQSWELEDRWYSRRGIVAAVRLEEDEDRKVKPHERTHTVPREDRVKMLEHLRTQVSPVLGMYLSDAPLVTSGKPMVEVSLGNEQHRLWGLLRADADNLLKSVHGTIYIADGHHRYAAAEAYRDKKRKAAKKKWTGDEPENFVMMVLVPTDELLVLPTHRVVQTELSLEQLNQRLGEYFTIESVPVDSLSERLAAANGLAFGMLGPGPGHAHLLMTGSPARIGSAMPADRSLAWRELDAAVLGEVVLGRVLSFGEDAVAKGLLTYTPDDAEAKAAVDGSTNRVAFLLRATRIEQVIAVAEAGDSMPQKSTYFYPKLTTGLVMYPYDLE